MENHKKKSDNNNNLSKLTLIIFNEFVFDSRSLFIINPKGIISMTIGLRTLFEVDVTDVLNKVKFIQSIEKEFDWFIYDRTIYFVHSYLSFKCCWSFKLFILNKIKIRCMLMLFGRFFITSIINNIGECFVVKNSILCITLHILEQTSVLYSLLSCYFSFKLVS